MRQNLIEKLSRAPNEWFALQILVFTRTLPDKHNFGMLAASAKNNAVTRLAQLAALTCKRGTLQRLKAFIHGGTSILSLNCLWPDNTLFFPLKWSAVMALLTV